ncbi:hypothetical protein [Devosia chinhatensis]|uniref:Uncharacterized protein n=1 Tax=Devosia chinhatensis TaxID=429727 RepID=A0A0F5FH24_9HYPH|nr:hypothetical protein [Devosia chinhatensis]KKB08078.1 hypothetical protein VE26_16020 [Devosia chinhatensis]
MGSHRAAALIAALLLAPPASAQTPGWHYSPLPGEGDRASLGCDRAAEPGRFTCLAVRCEDDFTPGIHIHSTRAMGVAGRWQMTLDREDRSFDTIEAPSPYGARLLDPDGGLFERLQQGTFVYLRHEDDPEAGFAYIDLKGSFKAIGEALYWCAPRSPAAERNGPPDVEAETDQGEHDEPPPPGTQ